MTRAFGEPVSRIFLKLSAPPGTGYVLFVRAYLVIERPRSHRDRAA